jgi:uncharacterized protein YbjT (DUF2867 family)
MANRTAVIFGASGSVGQALLSEILSCGGFEQILIVVRRPLNLQLGVKVKELLVLDMNPNKLTHAVIDELRELSGDVFGFSVLGVGADTAKLSLEEHRTVDVELNAAFARGLKASGKVQHLLFMSALGADHNAKTTGLGVAGIAQYVRVKGEAESAVNNQGPAFVSIFRPSVIIGSQHTPWLLSVVARLLTPFTPAKFRSIRTTEIAQAMVAAALHPPEKSAVYHYTDMMTLIANR